MSPICTVDGDSTVPGSAGGLTIQDSMDELGGERNLLILAQPFGLHTKRYPSFRSSFSFSSLEFLSVYTSSPPPARPPFSVVVLACITSPRREAFYTSWPAFCHPPPSPPPFVRESYSPGQDDDAVGAIAERPFVIPSVSLIFAASVSSPFASKLLRLR